LRVYINGVILKPLINARGAPVIDWSALSYRVVLRPDRRQTLDRRQVMRGGRRASDRLAFAVSSGIAAQEESIPGGLSGASSESPKPLLH